MNSSKSKGNKCSSARKKMAAAMAAIDRPSAYSQAASPAGGFFLSSLSTNYSMAEDLSIVRGTKQEQYEALIPQVKALLDGEPDLVANLANIAAALKEQFGWLWVGFYIVKQDELVLGPFQGPVACN